MENNNELTQRENQIKFEISQLRYLANSKFGMSGEYPTDEQVMEMYKKMSELREEYKSMNQSKSKGKLIGLYHVIDKISDDDIITINKGDNHFKEERWGDLSEKVKELYRTECKTFHGRRYYKIKA